ncbi:MULTISPECIES: helix-turn-helix domain-containing protein [unclassified Pseudomonas]|uniref:helix-turn-helix domain-containing protein n=1 Tax=unclassified Pseudomonas TaxID=196821 RepID=UPI00244C4576|nr:MULTISPECIES: helix-turn-helix domain-containing protein [unclassified Pseudomonas]MDH0893846.1 helix-turn-helix domain-containing protein [Pseudomonas sp. GD03875]MDH1064365.1 helix-turn-helix domain-containing protein [Pseudomonas sp. GD03985]
MPAHRIAVVAFDRITPFHLSVPCLVFGELGPGPEFYELRVCAERAGSLSTTAGFGLRVEHGLETLAWADTVIVPSWHDDPQERPPQALLNALVAAHARGARLVGLCLGAYVLAEAGLLDGRRATTHWAWARDFAKRFPKVTVDADVLYLDDAGLLTSAGTAAGIDCCLHLLRQQHGAEVANRVARRLVVPPHRQGGQAQFIEQPLPATSRDDRLAGLLDWVRAHLDLPHSLDSLAERALMSRRTFTRRFRQLTGATVGDWLLAERLALCQRLLEGTEQSVEAIATLAGFGSPVSLRHHFGRAFGVSPSAWRQTFRG